MKKNLDELYFLLFNAITSAVNELEESSIITPQISKALEILKTAQQTTEDKYINAVE